MEDLTLQLTIDETNLILESLGHLPFVRVYTLIGKIQEQAGQQLGGQQATDVDVNVNQTANGRAPAPVIQE
jgi:hypothetical protein